jgi:hypothetical protein
LLRDDDEAEAEEAAEEEVDGRGSISLVVVAIISLSFSNRDILKRASQTRAKEVSNLGKSFLI